MKYKSASRAEMEMMKLAAVLCVVSVLWVIAPALAGDNADDDSGHHYGGYWHGRVGDRGPLGPVLPAIAGGAYSVVRKIRGRKGLA